MIRWMLISCLMMAALSVTGGAARAQDPKPAAKTGPQTFDFKDGKQINAVSLFVDAILEPVTGYADGVSGFATFDPAKPEATTGTIRVSVESVRFPNEGYTQTIRGYALQGKKYPELTCELKKIVSGRVVKPGVYEGNVEVDFTAKGVTKRLTVPLKVNYFPGIGVNRGPDSQCDMLVVRSNFIIRRSDFGIAPDVDPELAADAVEVRVAVCGFADRRKKTPKPAPAPKTADAPPTKPATTVTTPPADLTLTVDGKPYPIRERMAFHKVPGVSVAVIKNFQPRAVLHFGEARQGKAVNDDTRYPVGAMEHPVFAAAALRAADRGDISLDADINTYLKAWKVPASPFLKAGRGVTVRDLLTQRSGFTYQKYLGYAPDGPTPDLLAVLKGTPPAVTPPLVVEFEPGTRYDLAAANFVVLEQIARDWAPFGHGPLDDVARDLIFGPLGLKGASFVPVPSEGWRADAAIGHDDKGGPLPGGWRAYPETGASGLWITPRDFSAFLADILRSAAGKEGVLLQPASARLMLEAIPESGKDDEDPQSIGFGISPRNGVRYLFRGGNAAGFYCHADIDPEAGNAVIVFMNRDLCWKLSNEVRDAVARAEGFRGF